jgi:predicted nucleic acid-binding protein
MKSLSEFETARPSYASLPVRFALDTSCLIPLVAEWHQQHDQTTKSYRARLDRGEKPVIPIHALLECYSVLTRLPHPVRTDPETAAQVLAKYFEEAEIAGLEGSAGWSIIRSAASLSIGGGRVYDAAIARAATEAGAVILVTWNVKHFLGFSPPGLAVRDPLS